MASAADHVAAILPEPFTVLGQKLKPLTLGHCFWLERLDCNPVKNVLDLITAVVVCCDDWEKFERTTTRPLFAFRMRLWQWRLTRLWKKDATAFDKSVKAFGEYIKENTTAPETFDSKGGNSIGAPWLYHLKVALQAKLGYSRQEILSLRMTEALWDYYTFGELEGGIDLVSEDDREMQRIAIANHDRLQELSRKTFGHLN